MISIMFGLYENLYNNFTVEFIDVNKINWINDLIDWNEINEISSIKNYDNTVKYKGHEITLPSETGEFEVDGVRRIKREGGKLVPTSSSEDVIDAVLLSTNIRDIIIAILKINCSQNNNGIQFYDFQNYQKYLINASKCFDKDFKN